MQHDRSTVRAAPAGNRGLGETCVVAAPITAAPERGVGMLVVPVLALCAAASHVACAEETSPPAGLAVESAVDHAPFGGPGSVGGRSSRTRSLGRGARDQYTVEAYYRVELAEHLTVTPDIQLIKDPALDTDEDFIWVAGLRARLAF